MGGQTDGGPDIRMDRWTDGPSDGRPWTNLQRSKHRRTERGETQKEKKIPAETTAMCQLVTNEKIKHIVFYVLLRLKIVKEEQTKNWEKGESKNLEREAEEKS